MLPKRTTSNTLARKTGLRFTWSTRPRNSPSALAAVGHAFVKALATAGLVEQILYAQGAWKLNAPPRTAVVHLRRREPTDDTLF